jgi:ferredoxin
LQPSGHVFTSDGSDSVLQAALDAGLTLPYGCRNGACGACKGKVIDGLVDHGLAQDQALSTADRASGLALFCCAKPLSDLVLECREVGTAKDIPVKIMPCRVQKIERVAGDVIVLSLKLPANERLQFLAGQYIEFLLKDGKRRAFSIANAPHDDGFLQLHVRLIAGGEFTGHVFGGMKEKDILRFQGPYSRGVRASPQSRRWSNTPFTITLRGPWKSTGVRATGPGSTCRSWPQAGRTLTATSAMCRCCQTRLRMMPGRGALAWSIVPCWKTTPTFPRIRFMPAARRS